jgi:peptide/nickel transport system ATP-binding protein
MSFNVNAGGIMGLAGESGCGKSMTALSIPNLLPQNAKIIHGEVIFNNQVLTSLNDNEMCKTRGREISVIFQEVRPSLNPLIRVGRQIRETLDLAGIDKKSGKRRVVEMLYRLGFDEAKKIYNAYPHQLSGGMCQRVMAAIAAIGSPRLLLADEPSSALDLESQQQILSLLLEMNRNLKTSIIIISHDLSIIQKFASRFLVMYAGKIVEEGPAGALFSPLHPYTKALIGAIPSKDKRGQNLDYIPGNAASIEDSFTGCHFAPRCKNAKPKCLESFPPPVKAAGSQKVYCFYPAANEDINV